MTCHTGLAPPLTRAGVVPGDLQREPVRPAGREPGRLAQHGGAGGPREGGVCECVFMYEYEYECWQRARATRTAWRCRRIP